MIDLEDLKRRREELALHIEVEKTGLLSVHKDERIARLIDSDEIRLAELDRLIAAEQEKRIASSQRNPLAAPDDSAAGIRRRIRTQGQ